MCPISAFARNTYSSIRIYDLPHFVTSVSSGRARENIILFEFGNKYLILPDRRRKSSPTRFYFTLLKNIYRHVIGSYSTYLVTAATREFTRFPAIN